MTNLAHIKNGEQVTVLSVDASDFKVKLLEMGITEGSIVKVLYRAPLGDPIAIDIKGYVLSLRKSEASLIKVQSLTQMV